MGRRMIACPAPAASGGRPLPGEPPRLTSPPGRHDASVLGAPDRPVDDGLDLLVAILTAVATVAQMADDARWRWSGRRARRSLIGGYRPPAANRSGDTRPASWRAATTNASSGSARASAMIAPNPTPGKMKALLACPMDVAPAARSTNGGGRTPVATIARPEVQRGRPPRALRPARLGWTAAGSPAWAWLRDGSRMSYTRERARGSGRADQHGRPERTRDGDRIGQVWFGQAASA